MLRATQRTTEHSPADQSQHPAGNDAQKAEGKRIPAEGLPAATESSPTPEAGPPTACPLTFAVWAVVPAPVLPAAGTFWLAPVDCAASL